MPAALHRLTAHDRSRPASPPPPGLNADTLGRAARAVGTDWVGANPHATAYYNDAEQFMHKDWVHVILPFLSIEASGLDLAVTMDLAAGHGRNTVKLLALARQVLVVDINQDNLHFCRRRFAEEPRVSCRLTNGWSLPAADGELSFLYSWDAMVHFDSDVVRAYVTDAARALRPGGHAFLHHSNYAANPAGDFRLSPHQRNFCTQALMHHWAAKAGLEMVRQQPLDWAFDGSLIDCLTLLRRPT